MSVSSLRRAGSERSLQHDHVSRLHLTVDTAFSDGQLLECLQLLSERAKGSAANVGGQITRYRRRAPRPIAAVHDKEEEDLAQLCDEARRLGRTLSTVAAIATVRGSAIRRDSTISRSAKALCHALQELLQTHIEHKHSETDGTAPPRVPGIEGLRKACYAFLFATADERDLSAAMAEWQSSSQKTGGSAVDANKKADGGQIGLVQLLSSDYSQQLLRSALQLRQQSFAAGPERAPLAGLYSMSLSLLFTATILWSDVLADRYPGVDIGFVGFVQLASFLEMPLLEPVMQHRAALTALLLASVLVCVGYAARMAPPSDVVRCACLHAYLCTDADIAALFALPEANDAAGLTGDSDVASFEGEAEAIEQSLASSGGLTVDTSGSSALLASPTGSDNPAPARSSAAGTGLFSVGSAKASSSSAGSGDPASLSSSKQAFGRDSRASEIPVGSPDADMASSLLSSPPASSAADDSPTDAKGTPSPQGTGTVAGAGPGSRPASPSASLLLAAAAAPGVGSGAGNNGIRVLPDGRILVTDADTGTQYLLTEGEFIEATARGAAAVTSGAGAAGASRTTPSPPADFTAAASSASPGAGPTPSPDGGSGEAGGLEAAAGLAIDSDSSDDGDDGGSDASAAASGERGRGSSSASGAQLEADLDGVSSRPATPVRDSHQPAPSSEQARAEPVASATAPGTDGIRTPAPLSGISAAGRSPSPPATAEAERDGLADAIAVTTDVASDMLAALAYATELCEQPGAVEAVEAAEAARAEASTSSSGDTGAAGAGSADDPRVAACLSMPVPVGLIETLALLHERLSDAGEAPLASRVADRIEFVGRLAIVQAAVRRKAAGGDGGTISGDPAPTAAIASGAGEGRVRAGSFSLGPPSLPAGAVPMSSRRLSLSGSGPLALPVAPADAYGAPGTARSTASAVEEGSAPPVMTQRRGSLSLSGSRPRALSASASAAATSASAGAALSAAPSPNSTPRAMVPPLALPVQPGVSTASGAMSRRGSLSIAPITSSRKE